jgi:hypothetical protein
MSALRHTCQLSAATAAALLGLPVAAAVAQQMDNGSTDGGSSGQLREKLVLSEAAIKGLTESLAVANGETELFKRKYDDLNTRVEALGIAPAGKENETLQERLLAAVRDMRILQKEKEASREELVRLTEAVMELLKTSEGIDAKSRLMVEEELRASAALTGTTASDQSTDTSSDAAGLTSGTVVVYKPELALVVANLGSRQGVKTGMPFQVWRGNRQVASVRVVDVRDAISGAIVQKTATPSDAVRTGDTLRIDTIR